MQMVAIPVLLFHDPLLGLIPVAQIGTLLLYIAAGLHKTRGTSETLDTRPGIHVLTPQGLAERAALTGRFMKRKMAEYDALKAELESLCQENQDLP